MGDTLNESNFHSDKERQRRQYFVYAEAVLTKYQWKFGGVAQLGEHLPCKQGVRSSILLISTNTGDCVTFNKLYLEN